MLRRKASKRRRVLAPTETPIANAGSDDDGDAGLAEEYGIGDEEDDFGEALTLDEILARDATDETGSASTASALLAAVRSSSAVVAGDRAASTLLVTKSHGRDHQSQHPPADSVEELLKAKAAKKDITVDHEATTYDALVKNVYKESTAIKQMTDADVEAARRAADVRVRGRSVPRPVSAWTECGLPVEMLKVLSENGWDEPFAVQRQAVPTLMAGRDLVGIAKTGSGKTLAFVVPLIRHVLAQRPLVRNKESGPLALILAPARELAAQIHGVVVRFASAIGLSSAAAYGGRSLKDQIAKFKSGVHVLVATPGRLIELLSLNNSKLVSLKRCGLVVLDEADRMFDMGFAPQVKRVVDAARPDKQVVLFSATFPEQVEALARASLVAPVEIVVGGRSKATESVEQHVDIIEDDDGKTRRLLQLLGTFVPQGPVIVFADSRERCDALYGKLREFGYDPALLHGGVEQVDRDTAIHDIGRKLKDLLVATSVAGRGLDVADVSLVVNYDVPNHLEDYVHRIGRTGRAGRTGTAHTFISSSEKRYAPDVVKALRDARQSSRIPPLLLEWSDEWKAKVKAGVEKFRSSGFTNTKGFTFAEGEGTNGPEGEAPTTSGEPADLGSMPEKAFRAYVSRSVKELARRFKKELATERGGVFADEYARASLDEALASSKRAAGSSMVTIIEGQLTAEIEINHLPDDVRKSVAHKSTIAEIEAVVEATVTAKGTYVAPGRAASGAERKLYLYVEATNSATLERAVREVNERIKDAARGMSEASAFNAVHSVGGATARRY